MRRVFLQMVVSLDGYVAPPDLDDSWIFEGMDGSLMQWIIDSLSGADTHLLGRASFQEQQRWLSVENHRLAQLINRSEKVVFSRTPERLGNLGWTNSRPAAGSPAEEIAGLKRRQGKDIVVPGGAAFAQDLSANRLIDEYRLIIHPVALGGGLRLFREPIKLHLTSSLRFGTGALVNTYCPREPQGSAIASADAALRLWDRLAVAARSPGRPGRQRKENGMPRYTILIYGPEPSPMTEVPRR
jgi:dihydrofolate reductase